MNSGAKVRFKHVNIIFMLTTCLLLATSLFFVKTYYQFFTGDNWVQNWHLSSSSTSTGFDGPFFDGVLHPEDHVFRNPRTLHYHWVITAGFRAPGGVKKRVYLINDVFPGPTIEARSGDIVVVEVVNRLPEGEGASIHWHGLHMPGSNEMDGAVGFTQCPIPPNRNFTYRFDIDTDQAGTFWYHSHSREQIGDGFYGGLVVHKPAETEDETETYYYDEERLFLIGDWYQHPADDLLKKYLHWSSAGAEPAPDSLIINGMGLFNCSMLTANSGLECTEGIKTPVLRAEEKKKYRFRIVNVGALAGVTISIPESKMSVIQVDGGNKVKKHAEADSVGVLYPGERVDLIVELKESTENPRLEVTLDQENFLITNIALTPSQSFPIALSHSKFPRRRPHRKSSTTPNFLPLSELSGLPASPDEFPKAADQVFVVYVNVIIASTNMNMPEGRINRTTWKVQAHPPLPLLALDRNEWDKNQLVPWTGSQDPRWIDVVINNQDFTGHPFHLHGFDFFVISICTQIYGPLYNPFSSKPPRCGPYNLGNPIRKDTIYIPAKGYVVVRFQADNEGIWLLHCHILWHHAGGMAMAFQVMGTEVGVFGDDGEKRIAASQFCEPRELKKRHALN